MSFGDKYKLELAADAIVAQKGTESEKAALKARLSSELSSGSVHGSNSLESVIYRLSKVNLSDTSTIEAIRKFIAEERKLKGGYMGAEFETPAAIFERYYNLAQAAGANRDAGRQAATSQAQRETVQFQGQWRDPNSISTGTYVPAVTPRDAQTQGATTSPAQTQSSSGNADATTRSREQSNEGSINQANERFVKKNKELLEKIVRDWNSNHPNAANSIISALEAVLKDVNKDAVVTLQASLIQAGGVVSKDGKPDGEFGNLTLGALEKIFGKTSGSVPTASTKPTSSGSGTSTSTTSSPRVSPTEKVKPETFASDQKALSEVFLAWKDSVKEADTFLPSSKEEIEGYAQAGMTSLTALINALSVFEQKYASGTKSEQSTQALQLVQKMRNQIAEYYRGKSSVDNKHYRNPLIALEMLSKNIGLQIPPLPNINDTIKNLPGTKKKQFIQLVDAKMKNEGISFERAVFGVMGNPVIKGAWDKVDADLAEKYEKALTQKISSVQGTGLNEEQKASLAQLKDMYGVGGWFWSAFNWKDKNSQTLGMLGNQAIALGIGIGGAVATTTGVGAIGGAPMLGYAAAALAGGIAMTGTSVFLDGKSMGGKDFLFESGVNTATFVAGGIVFKVVRGVNTAGKIGLKTAAVIGAEGLADVTIGVAADQARSWYHDIDTSVWQSAKENIAWALLPLALRGASAGASKGASLFSEKRQAFARKASENLSEAQTRAAAGDIKGATRVVQGLDRETQVSKQAEGDPTVLAPTQGGAGAEATGGSIIGSNLPRVGPQEQVRPQAGSTAVKSAADSAQVFEAAEMGPGFPVGQLLNSEGSTVQLKIGEQYRIFSREHGTNQYEFVGYVNDVPRFKDVSNGKIVTFDAHVGLQSNNPHWMKSAADSAQVFEAAEMGPNPPVKAKRPVNGFAEGEIELNKSLNDPARLAKAESILGIQLTEPQKMAIVEAHNTPEMTKKIQLLKEAGFTNDQRRVLLESGICGISDAIRAGVINFQSNVKNTPIDKLAGRISDAISGVSEGKSLTVADVTITRSGSEYVVTAEGRPTVRYSADKKGIKSILDVIAGRVTDGDYIKLATNEAVNGMLAKNLGKEVVSEGVTFRARKEGDSAVIEAKGKDGGYVQLTEEQLARLSTNQVDAIIGKLLDKNALTWLGEHAGKPLQDTPAFQKVKDVKVVDYLKSIGAKGVKIPKKMYDWTIGNMVHELGHSIHLPGLQKVEVLRTLLTGRSSHGYLWSYDGHHAGTHRPHFTAPSTWLPSAWTPSLGTVGMTVGITGVELYMHTNNPDYSDHRTGNQFLKEELLSNYFNYIYFGWLGTIIVENVEALDIGKGVAGGVKSVGSWAYDKIGSDNGKSTSQVIDGVTGSAKSAGSAVIDTAKSAGTAVTDAAKSAASKIGVDGK